MNPMTIYNLRVLKAWGPAVALLAGIILFVAWTMYQRYDARNDLETEITIQDQEGAIDVHETATEALRDADGVTNVDELLRQTDGLRDNTSGSSKP